MSARPLPLGSSSRLLRRCRCEDGAVLRLLLQRGGQLAQRLEFIHHLGGQATEP